MARCLQCGFPNSSFANFCGGCGQALLASVKSPASTYDPGKSTPDHLRDNILRSRAIVEGALRHVTVMFTDIRSSFEFIEGNDPEMVREILDAVIGIMVNAVHQYEGTVAQVLGDGIMALFGAPIAQEDHAERACYAALAMHKKMLSQEDWPGRSLGINPQIRVGLNSGAVVIGTIGNDLSLDYRAVGSTTHMASRMEQIALPGTTRMTNETLQLAQGLVHTRSMGPCLIKGLSHPIETHELTESTSLTRFQALISRGLSRFCGRESELQALQEVIDAVHQGNKRSIHVRGEPGIGKSRLAFEFLKQPATQKCSILQVNGLAYERGPYAVLRRLLRLKLENTQLGPSESVRDKLQSILMSDEDLAIHKLALESLLDIESHDPDWNNLEPSHRRLRIFEAFRVVLDSLSNNRPLVLLCEDLQWFDSESLAFLTDLMDKHANQGLLLLLTSRSDWSPLESMLKSSVELWLEPLTPENADVLVSNLIGQHVSSTQLRGRLTEHTYGNPLFIEEIVRSMTESGMLIGEPGDYHLADPKAPIEVPPSVESVITARIDRLSPELKELLTSASVIGDEITMVLLGSLLGLQDDVLRERLNQVEGIDMLTLQRSSPYAVYQFRHALIRDVFYNGLLRSTRIDLHARIVTALEKIYHDRLTEQADQLAMHAYEGELWRKSVKYQLKSCSRAVARSANRYAATVLSKGLQSLDHLPPDDTSASRLGVDMRITAFDALLTLGENKRLLQLVREAELMAKSIGNQRKLGVVYSQLATALWLSGEHDLSYDASQQALTIAKSENNEILKMAATHNLGMVHHAHANYAEAIHLYSELLSGMSEDFVSVFYRTFMASCLTYVGDFQHALRLFTEGITIADKVNHPYSQTIIREELGFCHLLMGESQKAAAVLEEAMEICHEYDVITMRPALSARLAHALSEAGRLGEAVLLLEEALGEQTFMKAGQYAIIYLLLAKANVHLRDGKAKYAIATAIKVEDMTRRSGEHGFNAYALAVLGDAHALAGGPNLLDAEAAFQQARSVGGQRGMRPLVAQCCLSLGRLYAGSDRWQQAEHELTEAAGRFKELGLTNLEKRVSEVLINVNRSP